MKTFFVITFSIILFGITQSINRTLPTYGPFTDVTIKTVIPMTDVDDPSTIRMNNFLGLKVVLTSPITINGTAVDTVYVRSLTIGFEQLLFPMTHTNNKYAFTELTLFSEDQQKYIVNGNTYLKKL